MKNYLKALALFWVATIIGMTSISVFGGERFGIKYSDEGVGARNYKKILTPLVSDTSLRRNDDRLAASARSDFGFTNAARNNDVKVDYNSTALRERALQDYNEREPNNRIGLPLTGRDTFTIRDAYGATGCGRILNAKEQKGQTDAAKTRGEHWPNMNKPIVRSGKAGWGHGGWWPWSAKKQLRHHPEQISSLRQDDRALRELEISRVDRPGRIETAIRKNETARRDRLPDTVYRTLRDRGLSREGSAIRVIRDSVEGIA